ncbi:aldo/keto reductase [Breznakiella homolactica]|uniref:Aldo/keto reductase n=1 Tax=Breznakiella homolactica TaxID=2798577 RepID=A0A7T7XLZ2_9SPIR|nr:aldo/keto reductase [Breznakiella homolactica]QQO08708.1 aldo/keto reductase [Breznakiella homolactica]
MKKLGFGLMRLPLINTDDPKSIDQDQVNLMTDYFLERGFTYFDTAYPYHQGMSEIAARRALTELHPRDSFVLADKMPTWMVTGTEDYQRFFIEQLERCGVEYFDYYLLHTLGEQLYADSVKYGGFKFLKTLKDQGKIRHIGFSYHDRAELLDRILTEQPEVDFVQLQLNYIDWDNESIESRKCCEVAVKHRKPVIVMEPVKGGSLAQVPEEAERLLKEYAPQSSAASWAVRFAASPDNVLTVLSGMSSLEQMEDNAGYMDNFVPLNYEEEEIIGKVTDIINTGIAIPCTACKYCVDTCPQDISIPEYFSLYNNQHRFRLLPLHMNYYRNLTVKHGKASDCIGCRACESHCPQHIAIADKMKDVTAVFDRA